MSGPADTRIGDRRLATAQRVPFRGLGGRPSGSARLLDSAGWPVRRLKPVDGVLGVANRATDTAYLFSGRIVIQAAERSTELPRTLGYVQAHEVGHLILLEYSHASDGLMARCSRTASGTCRSSHRPRPPCSAPCYLPHTMPHGWERPSRSSGKQAGTTP